MKRKVIIQNQEKWDILYFRLGFEDEMAKLLLSRGESGRPLKEKHQMRGQVPAGRFGVKKARKWG